MYPTPRKRAASYVVMKSSPVLPTSPSRRPYDTPDRVHPSLSAQSSPVTSHGSSSRFADSQSSFTSESASADPWGSRSPFDDNRVPATSRPPYFGTPPSPALSGRSRSIAESDLLPIRHGTHKRAFKYPSSSTRPRTAPTSPTPATLETPESPVAMGIKFFLSKPALPSPTRLSLQSDSGASSHSRLATPRKPRPHPPDLDVSAIPFTPGYSHPTRANTLPSSTVPIISQDSLSLSADSIPPPHKDQRQRNVLRRKPSAKAKERFQRDMETRQMATVADASSVQLTEGHSEGDPPSPVPYYTVYGTQSEHRITAGGPDDTSRWSLHAHVLAEQRAQTLHSDPSRTLSRKGSLSRRVSIKWKKATGGGVKADEPPLRDPSNSRSSLQEHRSSCRLTDRAKFTDAEEFGNGHIRSATDPQSKSEGSKIWKLMKRISTGGLRERFHADTAPPPVPPIPKELLTTPPMVRKHPQATSRKSHSASMTRNIAGSGPRPSIATSSSSPNSSEMASANFFHMSRSSGSSLSSYGEENVPGLPSMGDRHIVPPRELHHILGDHKKDQGLMSHSGRRSYSSSQSCSGRATPTAESKADDQHQNISPRIHTSPITHPIHSLTSIRTRRRDEKPPTAAHNHLLPDGNTSLSPPPRSARSASMPSEGERSPSHSTIDEEPNSRISLQAPSILSEASTAKMRTWSRSSTCTSKDASPHIRSAVNYRELDAPRRPPLTEREKVEIWDDLLERSEQAGGTLHLDGSGELESDNLSFLAELS